MAMNPGVALKNANTILYCNKWSETVAFYRDYLKLPITHSSDWFVEFHLVGTAHLSVAQAARATIKSSLGAGITLALQVEDADETWQHLARIGLKLEPVRNHAWGARVFYLFDPEGHRIEIWSPMI